VLHHVHRFEHVRFKASIDWSDNHPRDLYCLAYLYGEEDMYTVAEEMYVWALRGYEKAWGLNHTSTLTTVASLGALHVA
jgi:hypothetical protein